MFNAHTQRWDTVEDVWVTFGYKFDSQSSNTAVNLCELDNSKNFRSTQKGKGRIWYSSRFHTSGELSDVPLEQGGSAS
jgi:hypothetical protein